MKKSKFTYGADRMCIKASRTGNTGQRSDPEDGHHRVDYLPMEMKYGGLSTSKLRRLRQVEEENRLSTTTC